MPAAVLICHSSTHFPQVRTVHVDVQRLSAGDWRFHYRVAGDIDQLALPAAAPVERTNELWRHTCFEAFVKAPGASAYCEFNFAPSGAWAAYRFDSYRQGMRALDLPRAPGVVCTRRPEQLDVEVDLVTGEALPAGALLLALSAVLAAPDGHVSYWALAHPPGKADFHHADGYAFGSFAQSLP